MKYQKGTRRRALEYEKAITQYWKENQTFEKSINQRPAKNAYVFYDGPPFLTGTPHYGHLLVSTVKDVVARYQTMKGKRVERRWGWDCHGLPAEVFVEKQLGISNKKEIGTKISISDYVAACRAAMVKTGTEWEDTIERVGRWVEFKGAYKTMDNEYMESVWWAFKELYEKGKIYDGEKILIYCTQDATPISKSEVAMENSYQKDTDPSAYAYFKLEGINEHILAWTTTPWTLPANVAIAINPTLDYVLVDYEGKLSYVASDAVAKVFTNEKHQPLEYKVIKTIKGSELAGKRYEPLFEDYGASAHVILAADFVTAAEGTGIVHVAPAYGEDDYELCKSRGFPIISIVDEHGNYTRGRWLGRNIWEVNKEIAKTLVQEGNALKVEYIVHDYPHCHRCNSKLMYRAHPSWFMDIQGQKKEMLNASAQTNWVPNVLKEGRFANIIDSAPDWNLSRDRYWATPIPVWKGQKPDGTELIRVVGSYEEFETLTGQKLDDYHLPNVMDIEFEQDGVTMRHIGKVIDCWFESGSMPFAQFHYPFENQQKFKESFPADFITEAIDQTRGWFYSLTAVNVALFGQSPFKNLICTGFMNANDGKKMSKKLKNYTDPIELMDQYSADSFRMLLLGSPLLNGEDFTLKDRDIADVARKLSMVWNMFDFFTLYAEVDNWEWDGSLSEPTDPPANVLDTWVLSRLFEVQAAVDVAMKAYDIPGAMKPILPFIDDASNWFVRRSRKRFWRDSQGLAQASSAGDTDKNSAYQTLHFVLVRLSMILAPFVPFLAEELYQKLTAGESVHLLDWPAPGTVDGQAIKNMGLTRELIKDGLSQRALAGIKVRQPLASCTVTLQNTMQSADWQEYQAILAEELNVKQVKLVAGPENLIVIDTKLTPALKREGMMRDVIRQAQDARKQAGLDVSDRIYLTLSTADKQLNQAIFENIDEICAETLAAVAQDGTTPGFEVVTKIDQAELTIGITKK